MAFKRSAISLNSLDSTSPSDGCTDLRFGLYEYGVNLNSESLRAFAFQNVPHRDHALVLTALEVSWSEGVVRDLVIDFASAGPLGKSLG